MLLTFDNPTIVAEIPDTVPVNVGLAKLAFKSSAVVVALETGLLASDVLSTFDNPTSPLSNPIGAIIDAPVGIVTVPVNVGLAILAFPVIS